MTISTNRTFTLKNIKINNYLNLLAIFLLLIALLPFLVTMTHRLQPDFYRESSSMVLSLIAIVLGTLGLKKIQVPKLFIYGIVIISFLIMHSLLRPPIYIGNSLLVVGVILTGTILAVIIHSSEDYKPLLFDYICYGLILGAIIQSMVCIFQIAQLIGVIGDPNPSIQVFGTFGQRNLLSEYLFWSLIASCYLFTQNKIPKTLFFGLAFTLTLLLGIAASRSIVLYILAVAIFSIICYLRQPALRRLVKYIFFAVIAIATFQIITTLYSSNISSGVERLVQGGNQVERLREWNKAWLIFLDNPSFGHGLNSYAQQSYLKESAIDYYVNHNMTGNAHNIFLQLMVEIGFVGTVLMTVGFTWCIWSAFSKNWTPIQLTAFGIILITLTHSLVEFPLWNTQFLLVFIIVTTFTCNKTVFTIAEIGMGKIVIVITALLMTFQTFKNWHTYDELVKLQYQAFDAAGNSPDLLPIINDKLFTISQQDIFMRYLVERVMAMSLPLMFDQSLPSYTGAVLSRSSSRFPYPGVLLYDAVLEYRQGNIESALHKTDLLLITYPGFLSQITSTLAIMPDKSIYDYVYAKCQATNTIKSQDSESQPIECESYAYK